MLLGDSGTGKSHLLIGLGMAACERGLRVRYVTAAGLVNELAEAADERTLSRLVARYGRLDLLCLDELAYVHLDPRGAELLFQVLTEREERASIAVASNAPFSEWGQTFTDARLAAAVVDRLTFRRTSSRPARSPTGCGSAEPERELPARADHVVWVGPDLIITVGPNQAIIPSVAAGLLDKGVGRPVALTLSRPSLGQFEDINGRATKRESNVSRFVDPSASDERRSPVFGSRDPEDLDLMPDAIGRPAEPLPARGSETDGPDRAWSQPGAHVGKDQRARGRLAGSPEGRQRERAGAQG